MKGSGGNFSTGNDLNNFMNQDIAALNDQKGVACGMAKLLEELAAAMI